MEYLEGESLSEALIRRGPLPARRRADHRAGEHGAREGARGEHRSSRSQAGQHLPRDQRRRRRRGRARLRREARRLRHREDARASSRTRRRRPVSKGPTQEGSVIGTPNFMSPEQLTVGGTPNPLTDIWSLGACAFAAFTARIPFEGEVLGDIVLKVCVEPLPVPSHPNPGAPPGLRRLVPSALRPRPGASVPERRRRLAVAARNGVRHRPRAHPDARRRPAFSTCSGRTPSSRPSPRTSPIRRPCRRGRPSSPGSSSASPSWSLPPPPSSGRTSSSARASKWWHLRRARGSLPHRPCRCPPPRRSLPTRTHRAATRPVRRTPAEPRRRRKRAPPNSEHRSFALARPRCSSDFQRSFRRRRGVGARGGRCRSWALRPPAPAEQEECDEPRHPSGSVVAPSRRLRSIAS